MSEKSQKSKFSKFSAWIGLEVRLFDLKYLKELNSELKIAGLHFWTQHSELPYKKKVGSLTQKNKKVKNSGDPPLATIAYVKPFIILTIKVKTFSIMAVLSD